MPNELLPSQRIHNITLDLLNENPEYINDNNLYLHIRITGLIIYLNEQYTNNDPSTKDRCDAVGDNRGCEQ